MYAKYIIIQIHTYIYDNVNIFIVSSINEQVFKVSIHEVSQASVGTLL